MKTGIEKRAFSIPVFFYTFLKMTLRTASFLFEDYF